MKDKIFIAWSGSNKTALKVKNILESKYNYLCSIGGNADNDSTFASIGDTVIQQIKNCNQAIVIFQNKENGSVSNNLFFELGYVLARYGQKKIHCVKKQSENVVLPSDFDNSFVEPVADQTEEQFIEGIVKYFLDRQKMSITTNKMFLINNRYMLRDFITSHYSASGSKCSDYELAQYILFYMQASYMFGDEDKVEREISEFKRAHQYEFSAELALSVNICISFFGLINNIKSYDDGTPYIEKNVFVKFKSDYEAYKSKDIDNDIGVFDEWANLFIKEHLNYGYSLFANNKEIPESLKTSSLKYCHKYAEESLEAIEKLDSVMPLSESNDDIGIISLLRSYIYRNLYLSGKQLGYDDWHEWLQLSTKERMNLKKTFESGSIDSQLFETFSMEYYLALLEFLEYGEYFNIDEFDKMMYLEEIEEYLAHVKTETNVKSYILYINTKFNQLKE